MAVEKRPPWLWIGLGAAVVIAAVIAAVTSGGSGGSKPKAAANLEQTRPVEVTGTALPPLASGPDPAVGREIPDLRGQSFDGTPVYIRKDGRPKLVLFVAHWCPHCRREIPLLAKYLKASPLPQGVDLYTVSTAVSTDRPNYPPSAWLAAEGWTAPALADSTKEDAAQAFGLPGFPYFVAVDAAGKVVARDSGEISTDRFTELATAALGNR